MAELPALVSPYHVPRASKTRKWLATGLALICLCVACVIIHRNTNSPVYSLRSRHVLVPDSGLNAPLNPTSAAMRAIAPDQYDVTVSTTEGEFSIKVTRNWAPHAADRFYNLASNGGTARRLCCTSTMLPRASHDSALTHLQDFITAVQYLMWSLENL